MNVLGTAFSPLASALLRKLKLGLQSMVVMQMKRNAREAMYDNSLDPYTAHQIWKLTKTLTRRIATVNDEYLGKKTVEPKDSGSDSPARLVEPDIPPPKLNNSESLSASSSAGDLTDSVATSSRISK